MKQLLSPRRAALAILVILLLTVVFHLLVLAGIVPASIVWGGNAADKTQLYRLEAVSLAFNAVIIFLVLAYTGFFGLRLPARMLRPAFWGMGALFTLNTVGNLAAKSSAETLVFAPITALLALLCGYLALRGFPPRGAAATVKQ